MIKMYVIAKQDTMENANGTQLVPSAQWDNLHQQLDFKCAYFACLDQRLPWDRAHVTLVLLARIIIFLVDALSAQ
jgi:hypothetical protein